MIVFRARGVLSQSLRYQVTPSDGWVTCPHCGAEVVSQSLRYQVTPSDVAGGSGGNKYPFKGSQSLRYQVTPSDLKLKPIQMVLL